MLSAVKKGNLDTVQVFFLVSVIHEFQEKCETGKPEHIEAAMHFVDMIAMIGKDSGFHNLEDAYSYEKNPVFKSVFSRGEILNLASRQYIMRLSFVFALIDEEHSESEIVCVGRLGVDIGLPEKILMLAFDKACNDLKLYNSLGALEEFEESKRLINSALMRIRLAENGQ